MSHGRHLLISILALAWAVTAVGCVNLFRPADPEPPLAPPGEQLLVDYSTAAATLATMASAFTFRTRADAVDAYMGAFADPAAGLPFQITFDPEVLGTRPDPVWTRERERAFYNGLFDIDGNDYILAFRPYVGAPDDIPDDGTGRETLYRAYELDAVSDVITSRIAIGRADIELRRTSNGDWLITRWSDIVDPAYPEPAEPGNHSFSWLRLESAGIP